MQKPNNNQDQYFNKKFEISNCDTEVCKRVAYVAYLSMLLLVLTSSNAYADWFNLQAVKTQLIDVAFKFVDDSIGFIAFAVGGACTFLTRGGDLLQKGMAFGAGSLVTAGGVKVAKTVMHLG